MQGYAQRGASTYSTARSTPGKRLMAKGAVLWDGSSPRLSSHSSFPTTGASLNPWPAGRRSWGGRGRAQGATGGAGCPSPTREAGPDDDVAVLGVPVQDEVSIWGVLWGHRVSKRGWGLHPMGTGRAPGAFLGPVARDRGDSEVSPCTCRSPARPAAAPARAGSC